MNLTEPLWPRSRFNLTTPLNLLCAGASVAGGVVLYCQGYTYEGATLFYMLAGIILAYPYYRCRYTGYMTFLVLASLVPMTIWLQNKAVENGLWGYPPGKGYLIWITRDGQGPGGWTRHLWLGNDMPAMEYLFYPLFGFFQLSVYSLYSHLLPDRWFEEKQPWLRHTFWLVMGPVLALFIAVYFLYPNPRATDYSYWMMGLLGFAVTVTGWWVSKGYQEYTQAPAFWIWILLMAVLFMPAWEFFHSCLNRDWIYNMENTFPAMYTYRGASVPFSELFGYLTTATTFQALVMFFIDRFGRVVIKDPSLVPFSRLRPH